MPKSSFRQFLYYENNNSITVLAIDIETNLAASPTICDYNELNFILTRVLIIEKSSIA